jgi:hypothetical protein
MSKNSVTEYYLFINEQILTLEKMLEYHLKADATLKLLLESNLPRYSYATIHHCLWGVHDNVNRAKILNESLLQTLLKIAALMESPRGSGNNKMH